MYFFRRTFSNRLGAVFFSSLLGLPGAASLLILVVDRGSVEPKLLFGYIIMAVTFFPLHISYIIRFFSKKPDFLIDERGIFFRGYLFGSRLIPWAVIQNAKAHQEISYSEGVWNPLTITILTIYPKGDGTCVRSFPNEPPVPPYVWHRRGPPYEYRIRYAHMDLPAIKAALRQRGGLVKDKPTRETLHQKGVRWKQK